jgi:hypothetical protein
MPLHTLLQENGLANFCVISSSQVEVLQEMEGINASYLEQIIHSYEENYIYVLYLDSEDIMNGVGSVFPLKSIT